MQLFYWVFKRHPIFWEIRHFENSKRTELSKKEKSIGKRKGKEKRILENVHFQKKLDTIEDPHNKHTIEDQGCSWTTPLKNCLGAVFFGGG